MRGDDTGGTLRVDLLGPVRARRGDAPLTLGPVRRQAVLAALVLRAPAFVTRRQLLDDVWGADPPATGGQVLPSYVYALRKTLDPADAGPDRSVIRGGQGSYGLASDGTTTDLVELAAETARAQRARADGDPDASLHHVGRALELFRGEPLPGLPGPLADTERRRLLGQRRALHQQRVECLVLLGRWSDALDGLMAVPLADPHDESIAALRMRALYGSGRQADALAVYQGTRRLLRDDLGVEPGEELRRVHQAVLRRDDRLLPGPARDRYGAGATASGTAGSGVAAPDADRPAPRSQAAPPRNPSPEHRTPGGSGRPLPRPGRNDLPGDTACLVGRERELALLTAPMSTKAVSVVTVDGTAGVGKTTLVVRAAWALRASHPDGCLFVDLHTHGAIHESVTPQRALRRLLRAVRGNDDFPDGLDGTRDSDHRHDPDSTDSTDGTNGTDGTDDLTELVAAWRAATSGLRLLLVVDDALGADQVRPLLPAGPGSRVLVTGRHRLSGLDADLRITVEPLGTGDAVTLLRELLGESRADDEPGAALELARRCGGLPLALRIASARLQHRPSWSLSFLTGRMSDDVRGLGELRAGDRSVEAAFRMSYEQLAPGLRRAFRASGQSPTARFDGLTLAAMLGGHRENAEDLLEELVDASLLEQPHPGRYRMHDLVRAHARLRASDAPEEAAADRAAVLHLYTAAGRVASDWGPEAFPTGPDVSGSPFPDWREASAWLRAAGGELVDVVAYAAAAGQFDHACWIAEALVDPLLHQGHYDECRTALELALPCADVASDGRMASALRNFLGMIDICQGRFQGAHAWYTEALRHARDHGDAQNRARATAGLGTAAGWLGDTETAVAHLGEAVEQAARLGDDWLTGTAAYNLGAVRSRQGRPEQALDHYATAVTMAEKSGRPRTISTALRFAADAHLSLGRYDKAVDLLRRAAELAREAGDLHLRTVALSRLGEAEHARGHLHAAVDAQYEALDTLTRYTSTWLEMHVRIALGATYTALGRRAEARREFETVLSLPGAGEHAQQLDLAGAGLRHADRPHPGGPALRP